VRRQNHRAAAAAAIAVATVALGACIDARSRGQPVAAAAAVPARHVTPISGTADPCWDFASYACGSAHVPGAPLVSRKNNMLARRGPNLVRFLDELRAGKVRADDQETVILRDYYARCNDAVAREQGLAELRAQLTEIARIATLEELARALGRLRALGFGILVNVHLERPPGPAEGPPSRVAAVGMAGPLILREGYAQRAGLYQQYWRNLAALSGTILAAEADAASRVDFTVATLEPEAKDRGAAAPRSRPAPGLVPGQTVFPWPVYLSAAGVPDTVPIVLGRASDLERVDHLARLPLTDLRSYLRVALLVAEQPYLGPRFIDAFRRLVSARVGADVGFSYELLCPRLLFETLEPLLADAYLSYLSDAPSEEAARRMFEALRARMIRSAQAAPWMDATVRQRAATGLASVQLRLIGDLEAHTLDGASLPRGSFLQLDLAIRRVRVSAHLGGAPHVLEPSFAPALYDPRMNAIWVSPEMVRPPYVRAGRFNAVTFGALGAVIGHELGHALATATSGARSACVEEQLASESFADERIADVAGVQQALAEMEAELGDLDDRRGWREEFFLAYAQQLCSYESDQHLDDDPHPPLGDRINGTLAHVPAFAETYKCKTGEPLAPPQPCTVW
jgi:predicted metalloendopeptidase